MKVLALGGSGGMGRYAVQSLYKHSKIKKIYVADINADAAKDFSSNFSDKVESIGLDVTKHESLLEVMSQVDIAVNTTGPFFKFAEFMLVLTVAFHMFNGLRIIALDCFNLAGHQKLLFGLALTGCTVVLISASFLFVPQILVPAH